MRRKFSWQRMAGWVNEVFGLVFFLTYCLGKVPSLRWDRDPSWDFFGMIGVFLTLFGALMLESAQTHERINTLEQTVKALRKGESETDLNGNGA